MLFKKVICILLISCLILVGVACGGGSNNAGNGSGSGGGSGSGSGGGGGGDKTETATISADLLDGKIANFMGAEGIGIAEKKEEKVNQSVNLSPYRVAYADEEKTTQKRTDLVKETEDGVYDVCFHEISGEEKSYQDLNDKYSTHHHDGVECNIENCNRISDELKAEEQSGAAETVLSLDARVNKLYSVGNFTFMCVSSAVYGDYDVIVEQTKALDSWGEINGYPTQVCAENVNGSYTFGCIRVVGGGMIPIKTLADEKEYHTSNYWSDEYNQSYIIDNETGITYSLNEFKYIYSVNGGVIKVYNEQAVGKFDYYKPVINENGVSFEKYVLSEDEEILNKIAGSKMLIDIYGNMVFSYNGFGNENVVDEYGEIKTDTNKILAQKVQSVYNNLNSTNNRTAANEYYMAQRYHKGSDGRIYRVNFKGDMTNVSVNVLDENCVWQSVENNVDVAFDADSSSGYIAWRIGEMTAVSAYYRITCIKEGYAIYSTAACFDGGRVWERAYYNRSSSNNNGHFVGVVKISTDGNGEEVDIWSDEFYANGLPLNNPYSVILVGNTQMLYFGNNEICLRNVLTGEEKSFSFTFDAKNGYYCSPEFHNNLYVKELGYLNIENEVDFDTFSAASFAQEPVYSETQFDEYYKLLTAK